MNFLYAGPSLQERLDWDEFGIHVKWQCDFVGRMKFIMMNLILLRAKAFDQGRRIPPPQFPRPFIFDSGAPSA
jgi:hypothetical protein